MAIKDILLSKNYWVLNKSVVRLLGADTTLFIGILADADAIFADDEGWFFQTTATVEKLSGMKRKVQEKCIKSLKENGILFHKNKGAPMKRYFKLDYNKLTQLLNNEQPNQNVLKGQTEMSPQDKPKCTKGTTIKNIGDKESDINNTHNIEIEIGKNLSEEQYTFDEFWNDYDKKLDKQSCIRLFNKISKSDRLAIKDYIPQYKDAQPDKQFRKNPQTFLRNRSWEDEIIKREAVTPVFKKAQMLDRDGNDMGTLGVDYMVTTTPDGLTFGTKI